MEIKHNTYSGGQVQSLGFETASGKKATVGVVLPGRHDFGIAKAPEEIVVIYNKITINGTEKSAISSYNIKVGDPIVFEVDEPAAYICYY
jgi:uncharacterized protein YaiE (UPF0345 family)